GRGAGTAPRVVWRPGGGVRSLPQGDAGLLAGAVPVLRRRRVAADEQRPGAVLRVVPLPRAAVPRAGGGLARGGGPRGGPGGGGGGWGPRRRGGGRWGWLT